MLMTAPDLMEQVKTLECYIIAWLARCSGADTRPFFVNAEQQYVHKHCELAWGFWSQLVKAMLQSCQAFGQSLPLDVRLAQALEIGCNGQTCLSVPALSWYR